MGTKKTSKQKQKPQKQKVVKSLLQTEHEDDVHEALLCVLQTKKIPKHQLLNMAKYGGIENHVVSTLEKVRGVDINDNDGNDEDDNDGDDDDDESKANKANKKHKKMDFYDPSILASPSPTSTNNEKEIEENKLLIQEVIDLARGGIGGQYTNTLKPIRKKGKTKTKKKKKRKHKKRKRARRTSLDFLPISPNKQSQSGIHYPNKKRKLSKEKSNKQRPKKVKLKPKSKTYSSLNQLIVQSTEMTVPNKREKEKEKEKEKKLHTKPPKMKMKKSRKRRKERNKKCYSSLTAFMNI